MSANTGTDSENTGLSKVELGSIIPFVTERGKVSLSVDGMGTLNATGTIQVQKPEGATVRNAYLMSATTGFTRRKLNDEEVTIEGIRDSIIVPKKIKWDISTPSSINSWNHWVDITDFIKLIVDSSPAGTINLTIQENETLSIDGEILVVIFDNPNEVKEKTIVLLFGAQDVNGDLFEISSAKPIDITESGLLINMALGISYGAQGCASGQYSRIDINGKRLTTSAGGEDDGICSNGALITTGGLGDSSTNPLNPLNTDNGDPRQDDELYSLIPFINNGDSKITVNTLNPSNDDNILFAAFELSSEASVTTKPLRPLIFIPGILGTNLYEGAEKIWIDPGKNINLNKDEYLNALILNSDGSIPGGSNISLGDNPDVVREVLGKNFYRSTLEEILPKYGYKNTENDQLYIFPYDFRKDIRSNSIQ
ncbi:MAG TPA: hypothetical protein VJI69_07560, partial [Bacteroidia bacterium]|nr:hypothetical protein [Bacteroidia bacterium]